MGCVAVFFTRPRPFYPCRGRGRGEKYEGNFGSNGASPLDNPEINNAVGRRGLFAPAKMKSVRCEWQPTANGGGGGRDDPGLRERRAVLRRTRACYLVRFVK